VGLLARWWWLNLTLPMSESVQECRSAFPPHFSAGLPRAISRNRPPQFAIGAVALPVPSMRAGSPRPDATPRDLRPGRPVPRDARAVRADRAHGAARGAGADPRRDRDGQDFPAGFFLLACSEGRCSIQLSYGRARKGMVGASRFERPTPCSQGRCATWLRHAPTPQVCAPAGQGSRLRGYRPGSR
jgi:hypothetical protein